MSNLNSAKRLFFLSFAIAFLFILPFLFVYAQENEEDLTEAELISTLLEQIANLENQLATLQGQSAGTFSPSFSFNNNLSMGDCHPDVRQLQKILNSDPTTVLASSGPGSPGNETECFGPITRSAVIRFQHKHASEILHPAGLTAATGFVGPSTRAKLNSILGEQMEGQEFLPPLPPPEETPVPPITSPSTPLNLETVNLNNYQTQQNFFIQEMGAPMASPGGSVSVSGSGFTSNTLAVIGNFLLPAETTNVTLGTGQNTNEDFPADLGFPFFIFEADDSVIISIPENFPAGVYDLTLVKGQFKTSPSTRVLVRNPGASPPLITQISQTEDSIIIHGSNFTDKNTVILSGFGWVSNRSPREDGTLTISKNRLAGSQSSVARNSEISVMNENGFSQSFSIRINF